MFICQRALFLLLDSLVHGGQELKVELVDMGGMEGEMYNFLDGYNVHGKNRQSRLCKG